MAVGVRVADEQELDAGRHRSGAPAPQKLVGDRAARALVAVDGPDDEHPAPGGEVPHADERDRPAPRRGAGQLERDAGSRPLGLPRVGPRPARDTGRRDRRRRQGERRQARAPRPRARALTRGAPPAS